MFQEYFLKSFFLSLSLSKWGSSTYLGREMKFLSSWRHLAEVVTCDHYFTHVDIFY